MMAIGFACIGCGKELTVRDELAGKKGKCPGCGMIVSVPSNPEPVEQVVFVEVGSALEASKKWHVAWADGQTSGPHSQAEIAEWIGSGLIAAGTQLWHSGTPDWAPASSFPEIAALLHTPSPTSPSAAVATSPTAAGQHSGIGAQSQEVPCCPKCGSTSVSMDKKGFGVGKALAGGLLLGPLGLLAGGAGRKKILISCMSCGHQWTPSPHEPGTSRIVAATPQPTASQTSDIASQLEKLADLHRKGILTDEEFQAKKVELLSRL